MASVPESQSEQYGAARQDLSLSRLYPLDPASPSPLAKNGRWPDFMIIGAQKAGTTWLYTNLQYHPEIWMPIKEMHYLNQVFIPAPSQWEVASRTTQVRSMRDYLLTKKPLGKFEERKLAALDVIDSGPISDEWYRRVFAFAGVDQMAGEGSPDYCLLPRHAIAHIVSHNPQVKIILFLRDPIDRAWSHMRMASEFQYSGAPLDRLLEDSFWRGYMSRSNYPSMLARWMTLIPNENLFIGRFEDIHKAPLQILKRVCDFLGVRFDARFFPAAAKRIFEGTRIPLDDALYQKMKERMKPLYEELIGLLPELTEPWAERHYGAGFVAKRG